MVNGITFSEQMITSGDFAHFMYTFLNHANGITKGCEVSHADGNVYVQKGYFMQCGRMVRVIGVEEIPSPEVVSGQLYCKVVFEIDLTKTNTIEEFNQGYFKTLTGTDSYPELTQEDLDSEGTLHQIPWCQYIKTAEGITEFEDIREIIDVASVWGLYEDMNAHIADTANPHNVTAEQVGARPSTWMPTASEVGALPIGGGILNGYLNVLNTLYVSRTINEILYKSAMMPSGYTVGNENATALAHYIGDSQNAMLLINANGLAFRELVNNKQYAIYGEHNKDSMPFLPNTGGKLTGLLTTKDIVNNNYGLFSAANTHVQLSAMKNPNAASNEDTILQLLSANYSNNIKQKVRITETNSKWYLLYGEHNITCGTTALTAGTSSLESGCIYEMYE